MVISDLNNDFRELFLINGTKFDSGSGYNIAVDIPTSLVIRKTANDGIYELENLALGFVKVELTLPWSKPLKSILVYSDDNKEIDINRDHENNHITFVMNEKFYRVKIK